MSKKTLAIFLVIAGLLLAGGFWLYRDAIFSKETLKLEILGPKTAKVGDEIEYTVRYKNSGNFVLENPKLIFELPEHSQREDGKTRFSEDLEDIYPGQEEFKKFKAVILGKEEDLKVARAWLSYIPKNLSARYESQTSLTTEIKEVPINLDFDLIGKIEKGKDINFSVNYFSNVDYPLENISLKIEPLEGFLVKSSEPSSLDNREWKLVTLSKGQGGKVSITGTATSSAANQLNFSAQLGKWINGNFIALKEAEKEVEVISPLLFIAQQINGSSNYVASAGDVLNYDIYFRNIGSSPFDDLFAISRIEGSAFDLSTLQSAEGQIRPNDNLIIWDFKQIPRLARLNPGQEVKVSFSVKLKNDFSIADSEKNNLYLKNRVDVSGIAEEFLTKVNSKLDFEQVVYSIEQLGLVNTGPVPPETNQTTTYTIGWQLKNNFNDVKNVRVKTILPSVVSFGSQTAPATESSNISFDSSSREIIWFAGDIAAGQMSPRIFFQVALTPDSSRSSYQLISQPVVFAEDQFTGQFLQQVFESLNSDMAQ